MLVHIVNSNTFIIRSRLELAELASTTLTQSCCLCLREVQSIFEVGLIWWDRRSAVRMLIEIIGNLFRVIFTTQKWRRRNFRVLLLNNHIKNLDFYDS